MGGIPFRGPTDESISYRELERLAVAGAIDAELQRLLVQDPESAVDNTLSYHFGLSGAEKAFLRTLRVVDYHDFVAQIVQWMGQQAERPAPRLDVRV